MPMEKSPELEAVFKRLWRASVDGSIDSISNMISVHPGVLFVFTDDANWISGGNNVTRVMAGRGSRIGSDNVEFDRVQSYAIGDFGWVAALVATSNSKGTSRSFRSTAVFAIEDGVWKAVHLHTSVGVSDEETFGYELAAGLSAIIDSLTASSIEDVVEVAGSSGTVTLMFTDIEDSTLLGQERGDAVWTRDVQAHFDSVSNVVGANGGTVIKTLGDGTMAAFPTARNAADAAIGIEHSGTDDGIRVRIGIHTGEAISVGGDYAGLAVAKAARVTSAAAGGEILVSSTTRELLGRFDHTFGTERAAELQGLDGTHRLYPLRWQDTP